MPDASTLLVFAAASLALLIVPGPAVVYIVTRSLAQGRSAGMVSMLGVQAGGLVHVAAAAIGVSALLASSAVAFSIVKYAGAAYLVYLGVRKLLRPEQLPLGELPRHDNRRLFREGIVVNVLNPKTAIFFLAFLPQFVDPGAGAVSLQVLVLGIGFIVLALLSDGAYALAAGALGDRLRRSAAVRRRLDRVSGGIYVALGLGAAVSGGQKAG